MDIEKALDILDMLEKDTRNVGLKTICRNISRAKYYLLDNEELENEEIPMSKCVQDV